MFPNFGARPVQPAPAGGAQQDRANIDALLRGEFDPYEINMQSAERAIGSGISGSGFAQAGRYKLLDSEKLKRQQLGNQMLDPYLNREHQQALQTQAEAARMREIQADAEYAMQRLQASEAGLGARLTQAERGEMERLIERGRQAMDLERLGQEGRIEQTALGGLFGLLGRTDSSGGGGSIGPNTMPGQRGYTLGHIGTGVAGMGAGALSYNGASQGESGGSFGLRGYTPDTRPGMYSGGGDRNVNLLINDILKKYGFTNLKL